MGGSDKVSNSNKVSLAVHLTVYILDSISDNVAEHKELTKHNSNVNNRGIEIVAHVTAIIVITAVVTSVMYIIVQMFLANESINKFDIRSAICALAFTAIIEIAGIKASHIR